MPASAPGAAEEEKEKRAGEEEAAAAAAAGGRSRSEQAGGTAGFAVARGACGPAGGRPAGMGALPARPAP